MPYPRFDRARLRLKPLAERVHDLDLGSVLALEPPAAAPSADIAVVASRIQEARRRGAAVILLAGAHLLRRGCGPHVIDLMERGLITHIGLNGAGAIHDFEMALVGATTESVARYIRTGEFGMWTETGRINDIAAQAATADLGLGEAIGQAIETGAFPHRSVSVLGAGFRLRVPVTIHVSIGQDIIHQHPNCDGAALGLTSYRDFLTLAHSVCSLEGGVLLNYGTAVMGPEVYLKALSMARNVAAQDGRSVSRFTTAVFDLPDLGSDFCAEPHRTDPRYYFRPWKTILVRTVADGGESHYIQGDHRETFPALWAAATASDHESR